MVVGGVESRSCIRYWDRIDIGLCVGSCGEGCVNSRSQQGATVCSV
jgi:hypothetical protein